MQQLPNGIVELVLELEPSPNDAFLESQWLIGHQIGNYLLDVIVLLTGVLEGILQVIGLRKILIDRFYGLDKQSIKLLSAPLYGMSDSIREVLNSARQRLFFWWILRRRIGFCEMGNNNLNVSFRPHGTGLQKRLFIQDTTLVHVNTYNRRQRERVVAGTIPTSCNIVKCVGDTVK